MRHLQVPSFCILLSMLGMPLVPDIAGGQQALNWGADDSLRVATLERDGSRLEGEHVVLWFPRSLTPSDAAALVKQLDAGVNALWRRVGTHEWQSIPTRTITYYLSDDSFVSHASGRAAVFISASRVKNGSAPFLHEASHELLASRRRAQPTAVDAARRPLWLTEGLPDVLARLVTAEVGMPDEVGPFGFRGDNADALCAERARTPDGATMLPYVGGFERPAVLFTTDRGRYAGTFYTCAFSFTRFLVDQVGLAPLIALFGSEPAEANARLDTMSGKRIAEWRANWLQLLK